MDLSDTESFCSVRYLCCLFTPKFRTMFRWSDRAAASAGSTSAPQLQVRKQYWVTLKDVKQDSRLVPCFILELEETRAVIAVPGSRVLSERGG